MFLRIILLAIILLLFMVLALVVYDSMKSPKKEESILYKRIKIGLYIAAFILFVLLVIGIVTI